MDKNSQFSLTDYKSFIDVCRGLTLPKVNAKSLIDTDLCKVKNGIVILSSKGNDLQEKMNIVTKIHNQIKIEGKEADSLVDNALDKLGEL